MKRIPLMIGCLALVALGFIALESDGQERVDPAADLAECDLDCARVEVTRPAGFDLPDMDVIHAALPECIAAAGVDFRATTVTYRK